MIPDLPHLPGVSPQPTDLEEDEAYLNTLALMSFHGTFVTVLRRDASRLIQKYDRHDDQARKMLAKVLIVMGLSYQGAEKPELETGRAYLRTAYDVAETTEEYDLCAFAGWIDGSFLRKQGANAQAIEILNKASQLRLVSPEIGVCLLLEKAKAALDLDLACNEKSYPGFHEAMAQADEVRNRARQMAERYDRRLLWPNFITAYGDVFTNHVRLRFMAMSGQQWSDQATAIANRVLSAAAPVSLPTALGTALYSAAQLQLNTPGREVHGFGAWQRAMRFAEDNGVPYLLQRGRSIILKERIQRQLPKQLKGECPYCRDETSWRLDDPTQVVYRCGNCRKIAFLLNPCR